MQILCSPEPDTGTWSVIQVRKETRKTLEAGLSHRAAKRLVNRVKFGGLEYEGPPRKPLGMKRLG